MKKSIPKRRDTWVDSWHRCRACDLSLYRCKVVVGDFAQTQGIVMVGEGPGKAENVIGRPFVGPSGRLLRIAMIEAYTGKDPMESGQDLRDIPAMVGLSNIVACRPCDGRQEPNRQPTPEEAWACASRLVEFVYRAYPRMVVALGNVAEFFCGAFGIHVDWKLLHPSAVLRAGGLSSPSYWGYLRDMQEMFTAYRRLSRG